MYGGTPGNNIVFRNYNNEHVFWDCNAVLSPAPDGGSCFGSNSPNLTFWGFDVGNSFTTNRMAGTDDVNPDNMNQPMFVRHGVRVINNFFRDMSGGTIMFGASPGDGAKLIRGNFFAFGGYPGDSRGLGHNMYLQNPHDLGEADRSVIEDNVGMWSFQIDTQLFGKDGPISYMTLKNNAMIAPGHAAKPTATWPTAAQSGLWESIEIGAQCTQPCAPNTCNGSSKTAMADYLDGNVTYSHEPGRGIQHGYLGKGSCQNSITNNYFAHPAPIQFLCTPYSNPVQPPPPTPQIPHCANLPGCGTFDLQAISGNTFMGPPDGSGCPSPSFTQAHWPNNTYLNGFPSSGKFFKYVPNQDDAGWGHVIVFNWDHSANVTIDPAQMGCFTGEHIRVFNWQDNNPWTSTPIATQTGCATLSVSATQATRIRPGGAMDNSGTNNFPIPPDLGPEVVGYFIYPDWGVAIPTPTNTPTVTKTPTSTPTLTRTPTFTASQTPTYTATLTGTRTPTVTFTNTPTNTGTMTVTRTPTLTPTPNPLPASFSTGSCSPITAPMQVATDAGAFGGKYIYSSSNSGTAICTFRVPSAGPYRVWMNVRAASSTEDSMFVTLDAEAVGSHIFDMGEARPCGTPEYEKLWTPIFRWKPWNDRQQNCNGTNNVPGYERAQSVGGPVGIMLTAGNHTLTFGAREANAAVAWVIVTSDFSYDPTHGSGGPNPTPPSSPPVPGSCRKRVTCNGVSADAVIPCSMMNYDFTHPCIWRRP